MPRSQPALAKRALAALLATATAACQASAAPSAAPSASATAISSPAPTASPSLAPRPSPTIDPAPTSAPTEPPIGGIYAATVDLNVSDALADIPPRVWVPIERGSTVVVIDPVTFEIVDRIDVGAYPEHVSPSWDGRLLYVNNMNANSMTVIDPATGTVTGTIETPFPYNLYFTPDGSRAIVVQDMLEGAPDDENGLRFYSYPAFEELGWVPVPWAGADHLDFSADGRTLYLSCEYSGRVVVVDVQSMAIVDEIVVGGFPTDVRLAPDGRTLFVANQQLDGLTLIDTETNDLIEFIPLEKGSHGLALSRGAKWLYVTNRVAGSVSVVDIATRSVVATWEVGGSPDMLAVSIEGDQLWISNRWHRSVSVIDATDGRKVRTIEVGAWPHGLAYWPLPGRFSLGHNGNMR